MNRNWIIKTICALAGLSVLANSSQAYYDQTKVNLVRSANGSTFTVKYAGGAVALIELRLNGTSLGTRSIAGGKINGETAFDLDVSSLTDGENTIEVRLFDKDGKLLGTEKSTITTENAQSPITITSPKTGATLQGPVDIKVGLSKDMKNVYVSFFVDNQFRSMTNTSPYSFVWDTQSDANGWHEVETWVVDENSSTYKSRKTKVFVNNPGGRTDRITPTAHIESKPSVNPNQVEVSAAATIKNTAAVTTSVASAATAAVGTVLPNSNDSLAIGTMAATHTTAASVAAIAMGPKMLTPTGQRNAPSKTTIEVKNTSAVLPAVTALPTKIVTIDKGVRLPNIGSFAIAFNKEIVNFDVAPRVQDGIPLTPFRHLFEKAGGEVKWEDSSKSVNANGDGKSIFLRIGDRSALINRLPVDMELAPFIEKGRTIVPLSFIKSALDVVIDYDPKTNHVLITKAKK